MAAAATVAAAAHIICMYLLSSCMLSRGKAHQNHGKEGQDDQVEHTVLGAESSQPRLWSGAPASVGTDLKGRRNQERSP